MAWFYKVTESKTTEDLSTLMVSIDYTEKDASGLVIKTIPKSIAFSTSDTDSLTLQNIKTRIEAVGASLRGAHAAKDLVGGFIGSEYPLR